MRRFCFILLLLAHGGGFVAQISLDTERWKDVLEEIISDREDDGGAGAEELVDELHRMADNPINLNSATTGDLRRIPFLSDEQIRMIIDHRNLYGEMLSIYELKDVRSLDFSTIELLLPFVCVGPTEGESLNLTPKNIAAHAGHDLQIRYDQCLQTKEGYRSPPADSAAAMPDNRRYMGEPFYHSLKYSFSFGDKIQAGVGAEKDAGEPFRKGYDFYSFHFLLKNVRWLQTLALGDYRASFGQGLAIGSGGVPAQILSAANPERRSNGFTRHGSTAEYGFFRGGALTAQWGNLRLSTFFSHRKLDATIADSAATSIKTDGLHRLPRDLEKASRLKMQTLGGNLSYSFRLFSAGMTFVRNSFLNYPFAPPVRLDNLHHFRGHSDINISVDYRMAHPRLTFYGETAASSNKAVATLNALLYTPASSIRLLILHRRYDKAYHALTGNAFGQSSHVRNEQGLYVSARLSPVRRWMLSASVDRFATLWPAYGTDAPSAGTEYILQADYVDPSAASFYIRYKYRQKEKNSAAVGGPASSLAEYSHSRLRMYAQYGWARLRFQSSASATFYAEGDDRSRGLMLSHRADWSPARIPIRISLYAALFNADDYNARLTTYEKNLPHTYGFSQVYGKGLRLALVARWDVRRRTSLHLKAGDTSQADADSTGSGLETIAGGRKTDVQILLRQEF